jgi:ActR/RegA family two-component response regulator
VQVVFTDFLLKEDGINEGEAATRLLDTAVYFGRQRKHDVFIGVYTGANFDGAGVRRQFDELEARFPSVKIFAEVDEACKTDFPAIIRQAEENLARKEAMRLKGETVPAMKVLVLDPDYEDYLAQLEAAFSVDEVEFSVASTFEAAVRQMSQEQFDAAVIDVTFADEDGKMPVVEALTKVPALINFTFESAFPSERWLGRDNPLLGLAKRTVRVRKSMTDYSGLFNAIRNARDKFLKRRSDTIKPLAETLVAEQPKVQEAKLRSAAERETEQKVRVLIIEEDMEARRQFVESLGAESGVEVVACSSVASAIRHQKDDPFDLVVMDTRVLLEMPGEAPVVIDEGWAVTEEENDPGLIYCATGECKCQGHSLQRSVGRNGRRDRKIVQVCGYIYRDRDASHQFRGSVASDQSRSRGQAQGRRAVTEATGRGYSGPEIPDAGR